MRKKTIFQSRKRSSRLSSLPYERAAEDIGT
jgi:hypothetical protein